MLVLIMYILVLIGVYFVLNMVLITLSTFLAVAIINVYWRGDRKNKVPRFAKKVRNI